MSGRYTELLSEGWVPRPEEVRSQVGKPGSYTFEPVSPAAADIAVGEILLAYEQSWETYERLLSSGVAKEVARTVLPVGTFTEFYASGNHRRRDAAHTGKGGTVWAANVPYHRKLVSIIHNIRVPVNTLRVPI